MKRTLALGGLLGGVVGVAAVGYLAGTRVQSAAEIAARTSPPLPSVITVPVERTVLSSEVITRGTVQFGASREVTLPASALKGGSRVLTSVANAGTEVKEGDVAMAVSGRPVFILEGAQPAYRDLGPGASGEDVRQLESALARLGFDPGPLDGRYDAATSAAVERWYTSAGWAAQGPTPEQVSARRSADADARQASVDALDADETLRLARASVDAAQAKLRLAELASLAASATGAAAVANRDRERLAAEAAVTRSETLLRIAKEEAAAAERQVVEARDGPPTLATASELAILEAELRHAKSLVTLAEAELEALRATFSPEGNPPSPTDIAARQRAVEAASANAGVAQARLTDARGRGRPASPAELAAKKAALSAAGAAVTAATNDLDATRIALKSILPPAEGLASVAAVELEAAQRDLDSARSGVRIAERRVSLASARLPSTDGSLPPAGFQVPADEVLFFPSLPLRVNAVKVRVGERVEGPVITVTNSRLVVSGAVNAADARLIQTAALVRIDAAELGITASGVVAAVAQSPGTQGVDAQRFAIEITPTGAPLSIAGASVVLTINVKSTDGEVLAVPLAALSVAADGAARVEVKRGPGTVVPVSVRPGLAARGLVEVTPLSPGLTAGDLVVVGSPTTKGAPK